MKKIILLFAILITAGCITTKNLVTSYNQAEYAKYDKKGTAQLTGQAFLKTQGGEVRFGAGETVSLIPATAYSDEIISYYQQYKFIRPANVDNRWKNHIRETTADGNGNFEFNSLPAGVYYLECPIYWMAGRSETGHTIYKKVEIYDGDKIKVILTD